MTPVQTLVPWHYMWSQDFAFFHYLLQDSVNEPQLVFAPRFMDQSHFEKGLYTIEGHAWLGCLIKVDYLIDILKAASKDIHVTKQAYIFFSDADIIVKPGIYDALKPHMDLGTSMVFLKEGQHLNIGCMLLKVSPDVVEFWELVRAKVSENPGKLDQLYVNDMITEYPGTWSAFDKKQMVCSNDWDGTTKCSLLQLLSSNIGKEFHVAEKIFYAAQMGVDMEKYMKHVPGHIIPSIYKFQDMLAESYKRRQNKDASQI